MTGTWVDAINAHGFDRETRDLLVVEAQRTRFPGDLPVGFELLRGSFVDLGFRFLGLPDEELDAVLRALIGTGVAVPRTTFRVRFVRPAMSVVEPMGGSEAATLPAHWRQGVLVVARDEKFNWIGKRVPSRWTPGDLREYTDVGDGWLPVGLNRDSGRGGDDDE